MNEHSARDEICRIGASLHARGYVHSTAGNISVRLDDGFLVTPTDACLGRLDPGRLARLDLEGRQTGGDRASKAIVLHRAIYAAACRFDPGTRCILHTHSTHCVALTLAETRPELLPALTPYFVMKVGHVPLIAYERPGAPEAAHAAARAIDRFGAQGTPIRAIVLERLGPVVWHDGPGAAAAVLEELEETARLRVLRPDAPPLPEPAIEVLRRSFGARW